VAIITAASRYKPADDLGIVTCYFNSHRYQSKRRNFVEFERPLLDSGLQLVTVECAFGDADFELPPAPHVVRLRARDVMWQKERLLNLAIAKLPPYITKIAWLDGDILFENPEWAVETSRALDMCHILQPFDHALRLRPGQHAYNGSGERYRSFAAVHAAFPSLARVAPFALHGHTGLAWAARRDIMQALGLYDAAIAGGADHLMAHAVCGDFGSRCLRETFSNCRSYLEHFRQWAESAWLAIRGHVGFVPGAALHLWHGETKFRGHYQRKEALSHFAFDPVRDLRLEDNGLWCWSDRTPGLRTWGLEYFARRREDMSEFGPPIASPLTKEIDNNAKII
jgi:hypothetical protein